MAKATRKKKSTKKEEEQKKSCKAGKDEKASSKKGLRTNFLEALKFIKPGVANASIVEQSDLVLMDDDKIVSYNDEIAISHPFDIGITGGVSADELIKLLQKLPSEDIKINEAEDEGETQLSISCKDSDGEVIEAGFYMATDITIPNLGIDELDDDDWFELPSDFIAGVNFCLSSASNNIEAGMLTCINIEGNTIMSCDNFQATKYEMKDEIDDELILNIPKDAAKNLAQYRPTEVAKNDGWIHFRNDVETIYSARIMDMDYPNVKGLFATKEDDDDLVSMTLPKELKKTLLRAEILADSDEKSGNKQVAIKSKKGKLTVSGNGPAGWVTETVKTSFKGNLPEFWICPTLLAAILEIAQEGKLNEQVILFEGKNFAHVVARIA